jgi:hypothetical protein
LHESLSQHARVIMSEVKEPHYFALDYRRDYDEHSGREVEQLDRTLEHYLELFGGATDEQYRGESSVYYLYSKVAPVEIQRRGNAPGALVGRVQLLGMLQHLLGVVELARKAQFVCLVQQQFDLPVALIHVLEPELRIGRLALAGALQLVEILRRRAAAHQQEEDGPRDTGLQHCGTWLRARMAAARSKRSARTQ